MGGVAQEADAAFGVGVGGEVVESVDVSTRGSGIALLCVLTRPKDPVSPLELECS